MGEPLHRRLLAEGLGTGLLVATVVGSGIMAERLAGGNVAVALLGNTIPTGAILVVIILIFGPVSGAHFNPVVSAAAALRGALSWTEAAFYGLVQIAAGVVGTWIAHLMFDLPLLQLATNDRGGVALLFSEVIASSGLLLTVFGCVARAPASTPFAVGLYIAAAYWFTASTSFANPAVTIARALTDTFSGIMPANVPGFIVAQVVGMGLALGLARLLWPGRREA